VRNGDLVSFKTVTEQYAAGFRQDKVHNLLTRLHHNVIRTGARRPLPPPAACTCLLHLSLVLAAAHPACCCLALAAQVHDPSVYHTCTAEPLLLLFTSNIL
jgi:hypothetical protein